MYFEEILILFYANGKVMQQFLKNLLCTQKHFLEKVIKKSTMSIRKRIFRFRTSLPVAVIITNKSLLSLFSIVTRKTR